jgi:Ferric reductase like transmembrane component
MLLGLLIALRYSPVRLWPHRRINVFRLHNWTAYLVLLLIVLHPAVLLLRNSTHFGLKDVLLPINSPVQPKLNTVGAVSLYLRLLVILTSLLRLRMPRPIWRKLHYLVFPSFIFMFIHSVFTDPALSNGKVDLLDGGKVFVEICCAISLAAWGSDSLTWTGFQTTGPNPAYRQRPNLMLVPSPHGSKSCLPGRRYGSRARSNQAGFSNGCPLRPGGRNNFSIRHWSHRRRDEDSGGVD